MCSDSGACPRPGGEEPIARDQRAAVRDGRRGTVEPKVVWHEPISIVDELAIIYFELISPHFLTGTYRDDT